MHVLFTASQLALLALPAIATFGGHGHHGADGKHSDSADAGVSSGSKSTSVSASGSFEFEEKFTSGSIAGSWIQMAGAQHEDSLVFQQGGGIALTLRESEAQSTNIVSKLQFS